MNTSIEKYRKFRKKPDYWIILIVIGLSLFGLVMIGSASALVAFEKFDGSNNYYFVGKQAISLLIGIVMMLVFSNIDYRKWKKYSILMIVITLLLLAIAHIPGLGDATKGASRWIQFGAFTFQPSEIAKLTLIIYLASWMSNRIGKINIIPFLAILGIVSFLVITQPDLGTLTVIVGISIAMFFAAGGSYFQMVIGGVAIIVAFAVFIRSSAYRWQRFLTFLNPTSESLGAGYHINQALLAIGSGGFWGLGFGRSIQKYLYLPEPYTDSIFAIIAEELGFVRCSLVIIAFTILAWRGFKIIRGAPDNFGRLLATGIVIWIVFQAFVNIGALSGVLPLTGVPLPFISYGGTSLIATMTAVGILINISKYSSDESKS